MLWSQIVNLVIKVLAVIRVRGNQFPNRLKRILDDPQRQLLGSFAGQMRRLQIQDRVAKMDIPFPRPDHFLRVDGYFAVVQLDDPVELLARPRWDGDGQLVVRSNADLKVVVVPQPGCKVPGHRRVSFLDQAY